MSEEKVETRKYQVRIIIDGQISVGLMEKICKAVREKCGDTAHIFGQKLDDQAATMRILGTEEIEV